MNVSLRHLFGFGALGLAAWALVAVFDAPPAPAASARTFTSSEQCRACHAEAFEEWSVSWHAQAWTDPDVRALSNDFQNTDCIDCHASRPVFETGVGQRVLPRSARQSEGIDCIACHLLPESAPEARNGGLVAGTRDDLSAACRPVAVRSLGSPEYCGVCHDQHKTVEQWRATEYAARGIGCVECHMPWRDGDPARGRDHTMHGGHDIALVRSAVALRGRRDGARWIVEVENVGAGHHFPTDERSRASDVFWRPAQRDDAATSSTAAPAASDAVGGTRAPWRHLYRFRSPYRHEVGLVDTRLPAHATQTIPVEDPEAAGPIEVALFYKRTPYWNDPAHPDPEREAELVQRIVLVP